jgi:hypothetical protein
MALRPSTVDVLLALLEHTDASALLILMEPENVLTLLRHDGWTDDAVRKALKEEKKLPGELLLGLYERGRTTDELLAILGPAAVAAVEAERARPAQTAAAPAAATKSDTPAPAKTSDAPARAKAPRVAGTAPLANVGVGGGRVQVAGLVVVLAAALVPSMLAVFDLRIALALLHLGIGTVLGLVALVGAIGGALATSPSGRRWALAISGAVASVGGGAAVIGYALWTARMGRTSLLRIEIAAVCMIGMLPALALAAALGKIAGKRA